MQKFLIPVLNLKQNLIYKFLVLIWLCTLIWFWQWWISTGHITTLFGFFLTSVILFCNTVIPAWYFFFTGRMKRPNPKIPIPHGQVAIITTKIPSEPWSIAKRTLEAMKKQVFPYEYDVWLADESPDIETIVWCLENGVNISSRKNNPNYHNPVWPRRKKSKEGNLAFFYDTFGYELYDFVVQLDIDHTPEPSYLLEMIRPFANPEVGYVAAPSICDANYEKSWTVRARLFAEASMHGPLQAGYCGDGWAPFCIGSHYAVRTQALKSVGGLGPELAEDHSTTLLLNNGGWQGAFALNAIAHGDGAESFPDSMTQELQWSRSLTNIFFIWRPLYSSGLTFKKKIQFLFAELWYVIWSLQMFIGSLFPAIALITKSPWVSVNYFDFIARYILLTVICLLPFIYLHSQKIFRPSDAPIFSWENSIFQIVRWPWALAGIVLSVFDYVTKKEFSFKVTPKGEGQTKILSLMSLMPHLLLIILLSYLVYTTPNTPSIEGYRWLAILDLFFYNTSIGVIVYKHVSENSHSGKSIFSTIPGLILNIVGIGTLLFLAVISIPKISPSSTLAYVTTTPTPNVFVYVGERSEQVGIKATPKPTSVIEKVIDEVIASVPSIPNTTSSAFVELPTDRMITGMYDPSESFKDIKFDIRHGFVRWNDIAGMNKIFETSRERGQFPMITVEPYPIPGIEQDTVLTDIQKGVYDTTVIDMLQAIAKKSPQKVIIRFAHEMDLCTVYPWSVCSPTPFIAAYRHVVDISRELEINNVLWMWSPAGGNPDTYLFYPGDNYVDYIGITGLESEDWDIFYGYENAPRHMYQMLNDRYGIATQFNKPLIIAELGISYSDPNTDRTQWLTEAFSAIKDKERYPLIVGWVYFNEYTNPQSRITLLPDFRITYQELFNALQNTGGFNK